MQLNACMESLSQNDSTKNVSILVVDNSMNLESTQDTSNIKIIRPQKNLGFGSGCNLGAAQGKAPYILFLNPDLVFQPGNIDQLIAYLKSGKLPDNTGIIGIQLLNPDGSIQKNIARFPEFKDLFPRMLGLDRLFPKYFKPHYIKNMDYSQNQFVDQVPGAFFLVKRTVFEKLGGFDERFFMYYEDVDLSYRACSAGWRTYYLADIAVKHIGGGTTASIQGRRLFYSLRSRIIYVGIHFGSMKAGLVILAILLLEFPVRIILSLLRLSFPDLLHTIGALGLFIINLPCTLKTL